MSDIAVAALLAGTILVASTVSVEIGLSVALIELFGGFVVGNAFSVDVPSWLSFVGSDSSNRAFTKAVELAGVAHERVAEHAARPVMTVR